VDSKPTWSKVITNSERGKADCPHKFFLGTALGLVPDSAAEPLYKGNLFHKIMEEADENGAETAIRMHRDRRDSHLDAVGPEFMRAPRERIRTLFHDLDWLARAYFSFWGKSSDWDWEVLESEQRHTYPVTGDVHLGGIQDKLVRFNGQLWIVDHKTTKGDASQWYDNSYSAQGPAYVWMVSNSIGERVAGIIYDVANSKPIEWEPIPLKKPPGVRKHGPPHLTANMYAEALEKHGIGIDWKEWTLDNHQALRDREDAGYWFSRIPVPFSDEEIERARLEWTVVAAGLSAIKVKHEPHRDWIAGIDDPWEQADAISSVAQEFGWHYPRAFGQCKKWGRMCAYREFCERPQDGPNGLVFRPKRKEYEDL